MRADFQLNAFIAGELSSPFFARTDLSKYDLGLAFCQNFYVDFRGGVKTRGGMNFQDYLPADARLFEFKLGLGLDALMLIFTPNLVRFMSHGSYLVTGNKTITSLVGNVIGFAAPHGYVVGQYVDVHNASIPDGTYRIISLPTSSSIGVIWPHGVAVSGSGAGGNVSLVVELATSYDADLLPTLRAKQNYLDMFLYHDEVAPAKLSYNAETEEWSLDVLRFGSQLAPPAGLTAVPSAVGTANIVFAVTAVDNLGLETIVCPPVLLIDSVNYTTAPGSVSLSWSARSGAQFYRVYRSIVTENDDLNVWAQLGLIGETSATSLIDNNIVVDYSISPPQHNDPFRNGAVQDVEVITGGTLYVDGTTVVAHDTDGQGFRGTATVNGAGTITAITVNDGGSRFVSPHIFIYAAKGQGFIGRATVVAGVITAVAVVAGGIGYPQGTLRIHTTVERGLVLLPVLKAGVLVDAVVLRGGTNITTATSLTITTGVGAGASIIVKSASPLTGNYPRTGTKFQQRQIYAGTVALPNGIWGSKPGDPLNLDSSLIPTDADSYLFLTDSTSLVPIKHVMAEQEGLFVFHEEGVDQLVAQQGRAVTATNKDVKQVATLGVSDLEPIKIDTMALYATANGAGVQALDRNQFSNAIAPVNLTVLASHLFGSRQEPVAWAWDESPNRLLWVVRDDGRLLTLTYLKEQEIFAWTQHETQGRVYDICAVTEGREQSIYLSVERHGRHFVELITMNDFSNTENYIGMDSTLTYRSAANISAVTITEDAKHENAVIVGPVVGSAGWVIRAAGGIYEVISRTTNVSQCFVLAPATHFYPGSSEPFVENWTVTAPVSDVEGLWHLEGMTVVALVDGDPVTDLIVVDGTVTLPQPGTLIHVGLGYTATIETMPLYNPQAGTDARPKRIVGAAVRMEKTRGVFFGTKGRTLYQVKDSDTVLLQGPTPNVPNHSTLLVDADWSIDQQLTFVQRLPLPANILGLVVETEIGL